MLNFLTRYRHVSLFILLVFISLTLLSLDRPTDPDASLKPSNLLERSMLYVLQPFQNTVSGIIARIQGVWEGYIALVNLREENQELYDKLKQVEAQRDLYHEKALAYDRLKDTLSLMGERQFEPILARVIGHDPTNQTNTIIVNKGSADGVRESSPVITQDGIAGITVSVSKHASKVLLLIDPSCNVAAVIQRTRDQGIVGGQSKQDAYLMKYVNRRANIREGTTYHVTDAALQGLAKEGLPGFRITDHALLRLQEEDIPADILTLLEELQHLLYVSQASFLQAIETTIGKEQAEWYGPAILRQTRADLLARLQQLQRQTYSTQEDFLTALELAIGTEQTMRYQEIILMYVEEEETVVSSGLGGIFPKGLRIGTVAKVNKNNYGLFQDIEVVPSVDFSKLEEVLIIRPDVIETTP